MLEEIKGKFFNIIWKSNEHKPSEKALAVIKNINFHVWKDGSITIELEAPNNAIDINITNDGQIHTIHQHIGYKK